MNAHAPARLRAAPWVAMLGIALTGDLGLPAAARFATVHSEPRTLASSAATPWPGGPDGATPQPAAGDTEVAFFPVGERLEYAVVFGRIRLGTATMTVETEEWTEGARVFRTSLEIDIGASVLRHEERLVSWIEPVPFRSRAFERRDGGKDAHWRRYTFHPEDGTATLEFRSEAGKELSAPERVTGLPDDALDELAALYLLRTLSLRVGETATLHRYMDPARNRMEVTRLANERIRVPAGRFETSVFRPVIPAIASFRPESDARMYISEDERRLIVQLDTDTKVGRLRLYLTNYQTTEVR